MPPKTSPRKKPVRKPAVKPSSAADEQNQATVEDLEREGLGVASKE